MSLNPRIHSHWQHKREHIMNLLSIKSLYEIEPMTSLCLSLSVCRSVCLFLSLSLSLSLVLNYLIKLRVSLTLLLCQILSFFSLFQEISFYYYSAMPCMVHAANKFLNTSLSRCLSNCIFRLKIPLLFQVLT